MIVASEFKIEHAQKDGRRHVHEYHTDDIGAVHTPSYLAAVGTDYKVVMLARVSEIEAQIVEAAIAQKYGDDEDSAEAKLDAYVAKLSDADAKRLIGYTDDQLVIVRERA